MNVKRQIPYSVDHTSLVIDENFMDAEVLHAEAMADIELNEPEGKPDMSEERRHELEVAYVVGLPDHVARARYLTKVGEVRSEQAATKLRKDAWELLRKR